MKKLKYSKVICKDNYRYKDLTVNKEYKIENRTQRYIYIICDFGVLRGYHKCHFKFIK